MRHCADAHSGPRELKSGFAAAVAVCTAILAGAAAGESESGTAVAAAAAAAGVAPPGGPTRARCSGAGPLAAWWHMEGDVVEV